MRPRYPPGHLTTPCNCAPAWPRSPEVKLSVAGNIQAGDFEQFKALGEATQRRSDSCRPRAPRGILPRGRRYSNGRPRIRFLHIDIDTLRADHLGCYGYHRNASPNIDRIAAGGVRFDNCFASDAPCLPSRAGMFMGRHGIHTGVVNHGGTNADPMPEGAGRRFRNSPRPWH
ncbi:MAG: sulfatase-like hydrolase/transferase [Planctomycetota bacterium]